MGGSGFPGVGNRVDGGYQPPRVEPADDRAQAGPDRPQAAEQAPAPSYSPVVMPPVPPKSGPMTWADSLDLIKTLFNGSLPPLLIVDDGNGRFHFVSLPTNIELIPQNDEHYLNFIKVINQAVYKEPRTVLTYEARALLDSDPKLKQAVMEKLGYERPFASQADLADRARQMALPSPVNRDVQVKRDAAIQIAATANHFNPAVVAKLFDGTYRLSVFPYMDPTGQRIIGGRVILLNGGQPETIGDFSAKGDRVVDPANQLHHDLIVCAQAFLIGSGAGTGMTQGNYIPGKFDEKAAEAIQSADNQSKAPRLNISNAQRILQAMYDRAENHLSRAQTVYESIDRQALPLVPASETRLVRDSIRAEEALRIVDELQQLESMAVNYAGRLQEESKHGNRDPEITKLNELISTARALARKHLPGYLRDLVGADKERFNLALVELTAIRQRLALYQRYRGSDLEHPTDKALRHLRAAVAKYIALGQRMELYAKAYPGYIGEAARRIVAELNAIKDGLAAPQSIKDRFLDFSIRDRDISGGGEKAADLTKNLGSDAPASEAQIGKQRKYAEYFLKKLEDNETARQNPELKRFLLDFCARALSSKKGVSPEQTFSDFNDAIPRFRRIGDFAEKEFLLERRRELGADLDSVSTNFSSQVDWNQVMNMVSSSSAQADKRKSAVGNLLYMLYSAVYSHNIWAQTAAGKQAGAKWISFIAMGEMAIQLFAGLSADERKDPELGAALKRLGNLSDGYQEARAELDEWYVDAMRRRQLAGDVRLNPQNLIELTPAGWAELVDRYAESHIVGGAAIAFNDLHYDRRILGSRLPRDAKAGDYYLVSTSNVTTDDGLAAPIFIRVQPADVAGQVVQVAAAYRLQAHESPINRYTVMEFIEKEPLAAFQHFMIGLVPVDFEERYHSRKDLIAAMGALSFRGLIKVFGEGDYYYFTPGTFSLTQEQRTVLGNVRQFMAEGETRVSYVLSKKSRALIDKLLSKSDPHFSADEANGLGDLAKELRAIEQNPVLCTQLGVNQKDLPGLIENLGRAVGQLIIEYYYFNPGTFALTDDEKTALGRAANLTGRQTALLRRCNLHPRFNAGELAELSSLASLLYQNSDPAIKSTGKKLGLVVGVALDQGGKKVEPQLFCLDHEYELSTKGGLNSAEQAALEAMAKELETYGVYVRDHDLNASPKQIMASFRQQLQERLGQDVDQKKLDEFDQHVAEIERKYTAAREVLLKLHQAIILHATKNDAVDHDPEGWGGYFVQHFYNIFVKLPPRTFAGQSAAMTAMAGSDQIARMEFNLWADPQKASVVSDLNTQIQNLTAEIERVSYGIAGNLDETSNVLFLNPCHRQINLLVAEMSAAKEKDVPAAADKALGKLADLEKQTGEQLNQFKARLKPVDLAKLEENLRREFATQRIRILVHKFDNILKNKGQGYLEKLKAIAQEASQLAAQLPDNASFASRYLKLKCAYFQYAYYKAVIDDKTYSDTVHDKSRAMIERSSYLEALSAKLETVITYFKSGMENPQALVANLDRFEAAVKDTSNMLVDLPAAYRGQLGGLSEVSDQTLQLIWDIMKWPGRTLYQQLMSAESTRAELIRGLSADGFSWRNWLRYRSEFPAFFQDCVAKHATSFLTEIFTGKELELRDDGGRVVAVNPFKFLDWYFGRTARLMSFVMERKVDKAADILRYLEANKDKIDRDLTETYLAQAQALLPEAEREAFAQLWRQQYNTHASEPKYAIQTLTSHPGEEQAIRWAKQILSFIMANIPQKFKANWFSILPTMLLAGNGRMSEPIDLVRDVFSFMGVTGLTDHEVGPDPKMLLDLARNPLYWAVYSGYYKMAMVGANSTNPNPTINLSGQVKMLNLNGTAGEEYQQKILFPGAKAGEFTFQSVNGKDLGWLYEKRLRQELIPRLHRNPNLREAVRKLVREKEIPAEPWTKLLDEVEHPPTDLSVWYDDLAKKYFDAFQGFGDGVAFPLFNATNYTSNLKLHNVAQLVEDLSKIVNAMENARIVGDLGRQAVQGYDPSNKYAVYTENFGAPADQKFRVIHVDGQDTAAHTVASLIDAVIPAWSPLHMIDVADRVEGIIERYKRDCRDGNLDHLPLVSLHGSLELFENYIKSYIEFFVTMPINISWGYVGLYQGAKEMLKGLNGISQAYVKYRNDPVKRDQVIAQFEAEIQKGGRDLRDALDKIGTDFTIMSKAPLTFIIKGLDMMQAGDWAAGIGNLLVGLTLAKTQWQVLKTFGADVKVVGKKIYVKYKYWQGDGKGKTPTENDRATLEMELPKIDEVGVRIVYGTTVGAPIRIVQFGLAANARLSGDYRARTELAEGEVTQTTGQEGIEITLRKPTLKETVVIGGERFVDWVEYWKNIGYEAARTGITWPGRKVSDALASRKQAEQRAAEANGAKIDPATVSDKTVAEARAALENPSAEPVKVSVKDKTGLHRLRPQIQEVEIPRPALNELANPDNTPKETKRIAKKYNLPTYGNGLHQSLARFREARLARAAEANIQTAISNPNARFKIKIYAQNGRVVFKAEVDAATYTRLAQADFDETGRIAEELGYKFRHGSKLEFYNSLVNLRVAAARLGPEAFQPQATTPIIGEATASTGKPVARGELGRWLQRLSKGEKAAFNETRVFKFGETAIPIRGDQIFALFNTKEGSPVVLDDRDGKAPRIIDPADAKKIRTMISDDLDKLPERDRWSMRKGKAAVARAKKAYAKLRHQPEQPPKPDSGESLLSTRRATLQTLLQRIGKMMKRLGVVSHEPSKGTKGSQPTKDAGHKAKGQAAEKGVLLGPDHKPISADRATERATDATPTPAPVPATLPANLPVDARGILAEVRAGKLSLPDAAQGLINLGIRLGALDEAFAASKDEGFEFAREVRTYLSDAVIDHQVPQRSVANPVVAAPAAPTSAAPAEKAAVCGPATPEAVTGDLIKAGFTAEALEGVSPEQQQRLLESIEAAKKAKGKPLTIRVKPGVKFGSGGEAALDALCGQLATGRTARKILLEVRDGQIVLRQGLRVNLGLASVVGADIRYKRTSLGQNGGVYQPSAQDIERVGINRKTAKQAAAAVADITLNGARAKEEAMDRITELERRKAITPAEASEMKKRASQEIDVFVKRASDATVLRARDLQSQAQRLETEIKQLRTEVARSANARVKTAKKAALAEKTKLYREAKAELKGLGAKQSFMSNQGLMMLILVGIEAYKHRNDQDPVEFVRASAHNLAFLPVFEGAETMAKLFGLSKKWAGPLSGAALAMAGKLLEHRDHLQATSGATRGWAALDTVKEGLTAALSFKLGVGAAALTGESGPLSVIVGTAVGVGSYYLIDVTGERLGYKAYLEKKMAPGEIERTLRNMSWGRTQIKVEHESASPEYFDKPTEPVKDEATGRTEMVPKAMRTLQALKWIESYFKSSESARSELRKKDPNLAKTLSAFGRIGTLNIDSYADLEPEALDEIAKAVAAFCQDENATERYQALEVTLKKEVEYIKHPLTGAMLGTRTIYRIMIGGKKAHESLGEKFDVNGYSLTSARTFNSESGKVENYNVTARLEAFDPKGMEQAGVLMQLRDKDGNYQIDLQGLIALGISLPVGKLDRFPIVKKQLAQILPLFGYSLDVDRDPRGEIYVRSKEVEAVLLKFLEQELPREVRTFKVNGATIYNISIIEPRHLEYLLAKTIGMLSAH